MAKRYQRRKGRVLTMTNDSVSRKSSYKNVSDTYARIEASKKNKCPFGHSFGTDCDCHSSCFECSGTWFSCKDEQEAIMKRELKIRKVGNDADGNVEFKAKGE